MVGANRSDDASNVKRLRWAAPLLTAGILAIGVGLFALYWGAHLWGLLMVMCDDNPSDPRCFQPTLWAWGGTTAVSIGVGCLGGAAVSVAVRYVRYRRRKREADRKWLANLHDRSAKYPED